MSHGACDVTVGPGGQYATLEQAITDLLKKQQKDLCLCVLPGEQVVAGGLQVVRPRMHLKISGCGPGSRIVFKNKPSIFRLLESVTLRDLESVQSRSGLA